MGIIFGKFRKKATTLEILEGVEKEIKSIEDFRKNTEQTQKRIVGRFVVISVGAYLLTAFLLYFRFFPAELYDQIFYLIPLILAPVIILTVKRGLTWYYKRKISRKQDKLIALREEKKKILDNVKETETYKVAKTILDKYAPEPNPIPNRRSMAVLSMEATPMKFETPKPPDTVLRQRTLPGSLTEPRHSSLMSTPFRPNTQSITQLQNRMQTQSALNPLPEVGETPVKLSPMPRGILPKERSLFDKMVDYLMGDGPSNRFALICKSCFSHNGMAHKDEFDYVSFRCCYCFVMNEARKKRPDGPKLEFDVKSPSSRTQSESSESDKSSSSETESEVRENTQVVNGMPEKIVAMEVDDEVETNELQYEFVEEPKISEAVEDLTSAIKPGEEAEQAPPADLKD